MKTHVSLTIILQMKDSWADQWQRGLSWAVKFLNFILIKMRRNSGGENWGMKQTHFCFINLLIIHHNCQFPPPVSREPSTVSREVFKIVKLTMLGRAGAERRLNRIPIECHSYIVTEYLSIKYYDWYEYYVILIL